MNDEMDEEVSEVGKKPIRGLPLLAPRAIEGGIALALSKRTIDSLCPSLMVTLIRAGGIKLASFGLLRIEERLKVRPQKKTRKDS